MWNTKIDKFVANETERNGIKSAEVVVTHAISKKLFSKTCHLLIQRHWAADSGQWIFCFYKFWRNYKLHFVHGEKKRRKL